MLETFKIAPPYYIMFLKDSEILLVLKTALYNILKFVNNVILLGISLKLYTGRHIWHNIREDTTQNLLKISESVVDSYIIKMKQNSSTGYWRFSTFSYYKHQHLNIALVTWKTTVQVDIPWVTKKIKRLCFHNFRVLSHMRLVSFLRYPTRKTA